MEALKKAAKDGLSVHLRGRKGLRRSTACVDEAFQVASAMDSEHQDSMEKETSEDARMRRNLQNQVGRIGLKCLSQAHVVLSRMVGDGQRENPWNEGEIVRIAIELAKLHNSGSPFCHLDEAVGLLTEARAAVRRAKQRKLEEEEKSRRLAEDAFFDLPTVRCKNVLIFAPAGTSTEDLEETRTNLHQLAEADAAQARKDAGEWIWEQGFSEPQGPKTINWGSLAGAIAKGDRKTQEDECARLAKLENSTSLESALKGLPDHAAKVRMQSYYSARGKGWEPYKGESEFLDLLRRYFAEAGAAPPEGNPERAQWIERVSQEQLKSAKEDQCTVATFLALWRCRRRGRAARTVGANSQDNEVPESGEP